MKRVTATNSQGGGRSAPPPGQLGLRSNVFPIVNFLSHSELENSRDCYTNRVYIGFMSSWYAQKEAIFQSNFILVSNFFLILAVLSSNFKSVAMCVPENVTSLTTLKFTLSIKGTLN